MTDGICLSIVIPIYNAGAYLRQCMESLLATDGIEDTQIILVDDGSSDDSGAIAEEYASGHSNITVFHKENGGPSAARNLGLREASGRYVFFCDSDDEVISDKFSRILELTKEADTDIILWDADLKYETMNLLVPKEKGFFCHDGLQREQIICSGREFVRKLLRATGNLVATVWLSAYRRVYLTDNDFLFEEGIIHEDELWIPKVMLSAESILYIPEKTYLYRIRSGSITNPVSGERRRNVESQMYVYPSLYEYFDKTISDDEELKELLEANLTKKYLHAIYKYRVWRYGYQDTIDIKKLLETSGKLRHKIMALFLYVLFSRKIGRQSDI